jgi:hypothetical protein
VSTAIVGDNVIAYPPADRGPLTKRRLRRTLAIYLAVALTGCLLLALGSPGWQVFGIGLWFPGAGFLALGSWHWVLTLLTVLVFGLSLVAWFGAGGNTFPPIVWLASALAAAGLSAGPISRSGVVSAIVIAAVALAVQSVRKMIARSRAARLRNERMSYLPVELAAVRDRAATAHAVDQRELDADALAGLRYMFDRALQDADDFSNFDKIDQFQTSALRYQINQIGYALAQVSFHYTPAFGGYSHDAQNRLVEKYLERVVWGYWRWENAWGRLSLDADPAKSDNIMLTGYLLLQLSNMTAATGEQRWNRNGALEFRLNSRRVFRHDLHTLMEQVMGNFRGRHFTLWPCEPNWIYPACNLRGAAGVRSYDRLFGTSCWDEISEGFRARLNSEFATPDGAMVALRSSGTGFAVPFPMPNAVVPQLTNPIFPDVAERHWAISRREDFETVDGVLQVKKPPMGVDFGNYRASPVTHLASLVNGAVEMGDEEARAAGLAALNDALPFTRKDGVLCIAGASTLWNAWIAQDRTGFHDCWRSLIVDAPPSCVTTGPQLARVRYPDVLVASARNDGDNLRLVLRPGSSVSQQDLGLARLIPGRSYRVSGGAPEQAITADDRGEAVVTIELIDRLEITVTAIS